MNFDQIKARADEEWRGFNRGDRARLLIGAATCGRAAGALEVIASLREQLEQRRLTASVDLVEVGCLGPCYSEVLLEIKDVEGRRVLYHAVEPGMAAELVGSHLANNRPVMAQALAVMEGPGVEGLPRFEELPMIKPQVRVVLRNCGQIDPQNINHYIARGGYAGIMRALTMTPDEVIAEMKASGLRGRGGAGFPTGQKWSFARQSPADEKYIVCNADEGDPGAFMNRSVLEGDPHTVLEGLLIAGYAIGAQHGYVYCRAEYPLALERLELAIRQMKETGFLGPNILGSGFDFEIKIKKGAGAFVCGEETALMASIEGKRGMPRSRPPFPAVAGLFGKPTNINNVETLASVSAIMEKGASWYAGYGAEKSKGTKTFALTGKIVRTGLIEVPMGIPLRTIIEEIGGGIPEGKKFKAVQTGGPSGGCIPAQHLDLPVDYEHLAEVGSIMGSGGMVVLDEDSCMVDVARYFLTFIENESCGKCVPCRMGTQHLLRILTEITEGRGTMDMIENLERIGDTVKKGSLCGLGQTAANPVLTTLRYFRHEYEEHILDRRCRAAVCREIVGAPCRHTCPSGVDAARYVRLIEAGRPDLALRVVYERIPFPSVCGLVCYHPCETHCRRRLLDEAVSIRELKRFAVEKGGHVDLARGAAPRSGKKAAVVGAGPAGLTAAYYLRKKGGHLVTVFEALPQAGGMLRYGIPDYRLPPEVLDREIENILQTPGLELKLSTPVTSVADLQAQGFDAVFVAVGAHEGIKLMIPGEDGPGVEDCVSFLRRVNRGERIGVGKRVAVVGGGNAAVDAARVAWRQGADEVIILYRRTRAEMPAYADEIEEALEEGIKLELLTVPVKIERSGGRLRVTSIRFQLGPADESGRPRPVPLEGSEYQQDFDYLIMAIGQKPDASGLGPELNRAATIKVEARTLAASLPGVWAGGDAVSGPASVIEAIAQGRLAAQSIDKYLGGSGDIEEVFAEPFEAFPAMAEAMADWPRTKLEGLAIKDRQRNFTQVEVGLDLDRAVREAGRCLRCDLELLEEKAQARAKGR